MPRSPLPQRDGLDAAWVRTPRTGPWATMRDFLVTRLPRLSPERIDEMFAEQCWHDDHGQPLPPDAAYRPHRFIWFHRDLPEEVEVPFPIPILYRDERIVVVDKPHFLSVIPRGNHVRQSVVVKLRRQLELPELSPAHRLDRITAGVLLLTTRREFRAPYQQLFEHRQVAKSYRVLAPVDPGLEFPRTVRSHIVKDRGVWQAREVPGAAPNAETWIDLLDTTDGPDQPGALGRYQVEPRTGRTHQIRLHFASLGLPIVNDPLYPQVTGWDVDDFTRPLQLLAHRLAFTDPVDGTERVYVSQRSLDPRVA